MCCCYAQVQCQKGAYVCIYMCAKGRQVSPTTLSCVPSLLSPPSHRLSEPLLYELFCAQVRVQQLTELEEVINYKQAQVTATKQQNTMGECHMNR